MAERDVAAFIAHHVEGQLLEQLALGGAVHVVERAQRQPLDDHVHPDHHLFVAIGLQGRVDQGLEPRRHRIDQRDLVAIPGIDLDMAGLVHRLGRGIKLGGGIGHRMGNAGRGHQRALFTVEELREQLRGGMGGKGFLLRFRQLGEERHAVIDVRTVVDQRFRRIDFGIPGQQLVRIPLVLLGALVEVFDLVARKQVIEAPGD